MAGYPLTGVRILDMATVLAAPFAATLCADMGAEVIKVELPQGGDTLRTLEPVHEGHGVFWKTANRGKQGISLDVRQPEGRALLLRLVETVDVLVENFRTGTLDRWGLDLATLHAHNPRLIVLRLTGYGQSGPDARRPGFARIFEAMSGFAHLTGEADGPPQHMNFPLGDVMSGVFGAFAIAAALAERNGLPPEAQRGSEIDLSATEAMLRLLDPLPAEFQLTGRARGRAGARATYTAPSNVYRTQDGAWITLVSSGNAIFARLCQAIGQPELAQDERFVTNTQRVANLEALDALLETWCSSRSYAELHDCLSAHEVPFSKVNSVEDTLQDAHLQARQAFITLQDPDLGELPAPGVVPRFVGREWQVPAVGPATGEHNAQVFGALGVGAEELAAYRARGVV